MRKNRPRFIMERPATGLHPVSLEVEEKHLLPLSYCNVMQHSCEKRLFVRAATISMKICCRNCKSVFTMPHSLLQDNFRDLTSETIYLIISRICHTQLSSFNESSETKTNMQLIHSHIVKYAFSLQQRECLRIFVPKIATYFSTNKFTCYFFVKWHNFSDNGQKAGRHGKDDGERTEGRAAEERPRRISREY